MKKSTLFEWGLWAVFLSSLLFGVYSQLAVKKPTAEYLRFAAQKMERYMQQEANAFERWVKSAESQPTDMQFEGWQSMHQRQPLAGFLKIYEADSLLFWNSNRPFMQRDSVWQSGFRTFENVQAFQLVKQVGRRTWVYLIPVRDNYSYENRFLQNNYFLTFDAVEQLRMLPAGGVGQPVMGPNKLVAFHIGVQGNSSFVNMPSNEKQSGFSFLLSIAVAILLFFMRTERSQVEKRPWYSLLEFILPVVFIRVLLFNYRTELGLGSLPLFDPTIFASHWLLPSFGDLLLHLLVLVLFLVFLYHYRDIYHTRQEQVNKVLQSWPVTFFASLLVIMFFLVSLLVCRDLVFSSDIPIGIDEVFEFNIYTYLALITYVLFICLNAASFYLLFKYRWRQLTGWKMLFLYVLIMLTIAWLFSFTGERVWLRKYAVWWFVLGSVVFWLRFKAWRFRQTYYLIVAVWSLFVGYQVSEALFRKQIEKARYTARKIYAPNDATAVYLLLDLVPRIQEDPVLRNQSISSNEDAQRQQVRLGYEYLKGYLEKYLISEVFWSGGPQVPVEQRETLAEELLALDRFSMLRQFKQNARQGYTLRVPYQSANQTVDTLVLRLLQKSLKPESPFPNLLIEGDLVEREKFSSFSFAVYEQNQLIQQGGKYPYQLIDNSWKNSEIEFNLIQLDGLSHFIYRPDDANIIVVSFAAAGWVRPLSVASGFLILCLLVLFLLNRLVTTQANWRQFVRLSYRNRIEIALIGSVLAIMLLIGYITITYTVLRSKANTEEAVTNRLQDIQAAVEGGLRLRPGNLQITNAQRSELNQVAGNLQSDFSLFDLSGKLLFSSQTKLFERGLLGDYMHPQAFGEVARLQRTIFLQNEQIGSFAFKSAYVPLRDSKSQLVGILNMPSFDTEAMERAELNEFVGNLISLYFIILLLAGVVVFWLAERITSPIQLLTQVILRTKMGMRGEMPDWKREDEIGVLISSYNDMVKELDQSAVLLARSERESAWREMARQIAHEIRNPLTPMKLKLQRMMRDFTENPNRFQDRFKGEAGLVLEQIDVLAAVAGEFSSFAQVQVGEKSIFDLRENLISVIGLYEQQGIIEFKDDTLPTAEMPQGNALALKNIPVCLVFGDAMQVQRVFQNLIKNGLQAVPDDRTPEIKVLLYAIDTYWCIDVVDNGTGILPENREKIFQPNFTTKSSGMGLGLAIVKKIIEQNEGQIGFETTEGVGTRFYVRFPVYQEPA